MEYKEVVKLIEESEKRVDEVLKAARLQRNERAPMPKEKLELIFELRGWHPCIDFGRVGSIYDYLFLRNSRKVGSIAR